MVFFGILLYQSGDVEKNPGPTSVSSDESNESFKFPPLQGNLSMVHYNVQSLANKVDLIEPELTNFDIISLTETWLNDSISNEDLTFNEFQIPFRRDRVGDSHGGVIVYVKRDIPCKRRIDLEIINVECIWVEISLHNKTVLIGTFYRPPNASPIVLSDIENSIGLASDTGIAEIVVMGDFNLNMLNQHTQTKIKDICQTFNLAQIINEPTHYTETSSSIIDLILVRNVRSVEMSGVNEPFLLQDVRYHCPTYVIFTFIKPVFKSFLREIWLYNQGDFNSLRQHITDYNWETVKSRDVNIYASNFTNTLINLAKDCIPHKTSE